MRAHLFQGAGYYPESGLGDYKISGDADELVEYAESPDNQGWADWWTVIFDDGQSLKVYREGWYERKY